MPRVVRQSSAPVRPPGLLASPVGERPGVLLAVAQAIADHTDLGALLRDLGRALCDHVPPGYLSFALIEPDHRSAKLQYLQPLGTVAAPDPADTPTELPAAESPTAVVWKTQEPLWFDVDGPDDRFPILRAAYARQGVRAACFVPLTTPRRRLGAMGFTSFAPVAPTREDVEFAALVGRLVALAVESALTRQELQRAHDRLAAEKLYLEEEIRTDRRMDDIIGAAGALREVLRQVEVVAPTDSAVLISGETGTGKELIARAIHRASHRRDRTFVKLNCAAIPTGLLESELFGHEKGAFTGAVERRIGRFELADGGTLFLDEVGDIPLELQPKLLRVLQEQEFERLGSGKTITVDVRLVAATHRNLAKMVAEGMFRADLFYRLHVFPISIPPLRERVDDIPELARHFVALFARRLGKPVQTVTPETMAAFMKYPWPGNVRELEHLIERAVILSPGPELRVPEMDLAATSAATTASAPIEPLGPTLRESERELIRRTLAECGGVVGGPDGAAVRLGMKRTTLLSRMKKLGLPRRAVE